MDRHLERNFCRGGIVVTEAHRSCYIAVIQPVELGAAVFLVVDPGVAEVIGAARITARGLGKPGFPEEGQFASVVQGNAVQNNFLGTEVQHQFFRA